MTKRALLLGLLGAAFLTFAALGVWQMERLQWKLALIDRVEHRIHAAPQPAPDAAGPDDEYRRVTAAGVYAQGKDALVQAVTERGPGYWVMTPLVMTNGRVLLVNRGFTPADKRDAPTPEGPVSVTGLLRLSEPKGGFLRANDPAAGRWFSRDVQAIAKAKNVANAAPYFIDAEADSKDPTAYPIGGLTVVRFPNNHLQYALTWFAMAALTIVAGLTVVTRGGRRDD